MKELKWDYDVATAHWARKWCPLSINTSSPCEQYDGSKYQLFENTWKKHMRNGDFPEYCHHPQRKGYLLCSPSNIIKCFEDGKPLEALILTIGWGGMTRAKGGIYVKPNQVIEETLLECLQLIRESNGVKDSWSLLVSDLRWSDVITSKVLHFLARSLGYETNPPVPIDNKVIVQRVWPKFKEAIVREGQLGDPPVPRGWRDSSVSWEAYSRYMTAVKCWSDCKGWTTTQLENTLFQEYYHLK